VERKLNIYNPVFSLKITYESESLRPVWRLFVIMGISYAIFILVIISVPFPFLRNRFPKVKDI